jgi:hypothetical protein
MFEALLELLADVGCMLEVVSFGFEVATVAKEIPEA